MDMDMDTAVLTVTEAAQALRLSRSFTYALVARGDLPSLRLGRRVLIPRAALKLYIETHAFGGDAPAASA
jgi:excisionase family DNA binding protein